MAMALRPRASPCVMSSRYASQALAEGLEGFVGGPESVVTPMAGFAVSGSSLQEGVSGLELAGMAGFAGSGSVVTCMAAFAGARRPHPPGRRTGTPAALR